jgi:hypothetical protein
VCDTVWLQRLAYLADSFTEIEELNSLLQGTTGYIYLGT